MASALRRLRQAAGLPSSAASQMIDHTNPAESLSTIAQEARRLLLTEQISFHRFFPFMLRCMATAHNIHGALRCMVDISASISCSGWANPWLVEDQERLTVRWLPFSGDRDKIFVHQLRAIAINLTALDWLSGGRLEGFHADFAYSPLSSHELSRLFPYDFSFCQTTSQSISRRDGDMPVVRSPRDIDEFLVHMSALSLFGLDHQSSVSREVFSLLVSGLHFKRKIPSLDDVSNTLRVCPATVRRKLSSEETSFRALRERAMNAAAKELLEQTSATIAEIAEQLGYSDERAFRRAFSDWNGRSPTVYRQNFQHGHTGQELLTGTAFA